MYFMPEDGRLDRNM